jgi:F-type H+-transporting ATPase subunit alpha
MDVVDQVIVIYAANKGYIDAYELPVLTRYKAELLQYVRTSHTKLIESLGKKRAIDAETEPLVQAALKGFGEVFDPKKGR